MKNQITMLEAFPEIFSGGEYENSEKEIMSTKEKFKDAITYYFKKHGYAPSFRELAEMVGIKSTSTVHKYMNLLFEEGFIESDAEDRFCQPRAFRVAGYRCVEVRE